MEIASRVPLMTYPKLPPLSEVSFPASFLFPKNISNHDIMFV
jgi:hypothetical protein